MISQFNLFRYVDGTTIVHRADARSKVVGLTALVFAFSFSPSWIAVGIIWALVVLLFVAARLPVSVIPRPPRLLYAAMVIAMFFGILSGGEPFVSVGERQLGIGGAIFQIRFFGVTLGLLALSLLIGWTTKAADLPRAAEWMLRPLRWVRVPIDELVAALTIAVRALPLVADEFALVTTLWRTRPKREGPRDVRHYLVDGMDVAATVTAASVRRARELGEAIEQRGSVGIAYQQPRWVFADAVIFVALVSAAVGIVLVPS